MMGGGMPMMGSPFGMRMQQPFASPYDGGAAGMANMSGMLGGAYGGGAGASMIGGQQLPAGFVPFSFNAAAEAPVASLSDAEVRDLEGAEREKVVARIEFLRRYRAELDAMLGRFGQYNTVQRQVDSCTTTPAAAAAAAAMAGSAAGAAGAAGGPIARSASAPEASSSLAAQQEATRQLRLRKFSTNEKKDEAEN